MVWGIFTRLCDRYCSQSQTISITPKGNPVSLAVAPRSPSSQPLATTDLTSCPCRSVCPTDLVKMQPYHVRVWSPPPFPDREVFKAHPCCSMTQNFLPLIAL